jgi:hypothetical protein
VDEGEIGAGELVIAGGEAAVLLEPTDQALDDIAFAVGAPVHQAWSGFGRELRDDRGDAVSAEMIADRPAGIATIGQERPRPPARPATARAFDRAGGHQGRERSLLVPLARGQDEGERPAAALAAQMQLAAEPTARAAEGLIRLPPLAPAA